MKVMLDSQIYDLIIQTPGMTERLNKLSAEGKLVILSTHIQEDELGDDPDSEKRRLVLTITRTKVVTNGMVVGVSRVGAATVGGGSGGVTIDNIRTQQGKHTNDALIATTAAKNADVLVTEDRRLHNRMKAVRARCEVWGFSQFKEYAFRDCTGAVALAGDDGA